MPLRAGRKLVKLPEANYSDPIQTYKNGRDKSLPKNFSVICFRHAPGLTAVQAPPGWRSHAAATSRGLDCLKLGPTLRLCEKHAIRRLTINHRAVAIVPACKEICLRRRTP